MGRTKSYYDLRDALAAPGCPVCRVSNVAVEAFLDGLIYEKVNNPVLRQAMREARGFCARHAWGLVRHGAALGSAIMMRDVLRTLQRTLTEARYRSTPMFSLTRVQESVNPQQPRASTAEIVEALSPQSPCPVCADEAKVEAGLITSFVENLTGKGGLLALYRESAGFCLPHLRQVLSQVGDQAAFEALTEVQLGIWGRLEGELDEVIRKSDYRFTGEGVGVEGTAWLRAIGTTAGERFGEGAQRGNQESPSSVTTRGQEPLVDDLPMGEDEAAAHD